MRKIILIGLCVILLFGLSGLGLLAKEAKNNNVYLPLIVNGRSLIPEPNGTPTKHEFPVTLIKPTVTKVEP